MNSASNPRGTVRWFRRHPRLALCLLVTMGTVISDFAVGSTLHAAGVTLPGMPPTTGHWVPHPVYHHALRANADYESGWGWIRYKVRTNSLGMKDARVRDVPLRSESKRVLLMGDSFTEGVGIEHKNTFAGVLARRFTGAGVEFLNGGVASYSPTVYLRKIRHLVDSVGLQIEHVSVAIDMSDIGDEIGYSHGRDWKDHVSFSQAVKKFLGEHTMLIGALWVWIREIKEAMNSEKLLGLHQRKCKWAMDEDAWKSYGERGMTLAVQHMTELHEFLMSKNITMNVMIYPWPDQIMLKDLDCRQVKTWTTWAKEHNVDLINLFPEFIGSAHPEEILKRYFIRGDVHWNEAGHALVASRLEQYFRKLVSRFR
jgi:hypothetical protein